MENVISLFLNVLLTLSNVAIAVVLIVGVCKMNKEK